MQDCWQHVLAIKSDKELMELFLGSTCNMIKILGFKICIFSGNLVLQALLLFLNLRLRTWPGRERFRASAGMCRYTVQCDAGGVRTQQILRQDGTVCQTAGAVVCDSRPAIAASPSSQAELETSSTVPSSSFTYSGVLL